MELKGPQVCLRGICLLGHVVPGHGVACGERPGPWLSSPVLCALHLHPHPYPGRWKTRGNRATLEAAQQWPSRGSLLSPHPHHGSDSPRAPAFAPLACAQPRAGPPFEQVQAALGAGHTGWGAGGLGHASSESSGMTSLLMATLGWVSEGCPERVPSMGRTGSGVASDCSEGSAAVLLTSCPHGEWGAGQGPSQVLEHSILGADVALLKWLHGKF